MTTIHLTASLFAIGTLLLGGYLIGVQAGRNARRALRRELANAEARALGTLGITGCQAIEAMDQLGSQLRRMKAEMQPAPPAQERQSLKRIEALLSEQSARENRLLDKLQSDIVPALSRAQHEELSTLTGQLEPLLARDQMAMALGSIAPSLAESDDLRGALTRIAREAGFVTVVLSDDIGLPMASNEGGKDSDLHAGLSSLLLTLVDRIEGNDLPAPISAVFQDEANRFVLQRVFRIGPNRYVLTAVAAGQTLAPDALDQVLPGIEHILDRQRW